MCLEAQSPLRTILDQSLYYLEALAIFLNRFVLDITRLDIEMVEALLQVIIQSQVLTAIYYLQFITSSLFYGNIRI